MTIKNFYDSSGKRHLFISTTNHGVVDGTHSLGEGAGYDASCMTRIGRDVDDLASLLDEVGGVPLTTPYHIQQ